MDKDLFYKNLFSDSFFCYIIKEIKEREMIILEKKKFHIFEGEREDKVLVGQILMEYKDGYIIETMEGKIQYATHYYNKVNENSTAQDFMEHIAEKFQNKFKRNVLITETDYLFNISIPRFYTDDYISLDDIEYLMNDVLEDWWSVQWLELNVNNIHCKLDRIEISFRVHDVHEAEFRFNDLLIEEE